MSSDASSSNPTGASLLTVLNARLASSNRQETWTRLHFVATMRSDSSAGLEDLCGKVSAAHKKVGGHGTDAATALLGGLVIISNAAVMGFLEGPAGKVYGFCNEIKGSNTFGIIRVISSVEDCPSRDLKRWGVYSANPPSDDEVDIRSEGASVVASLLVSSIMRDAADFPEGNPMGITPLGRAGGAAVSMPSANKVLGCCKSDLFPDLGEYLALFADPISVEVESDRMWPLQSLVDN